jgi:hypothetical protein
MLVAGMLVAGYGVYLGIQAGAGHADVLDGTFVVPAAIYFAFAGVAALGAGSDAWAVARGGFGHRARIIQHLWRMCVALYIAASSFFDGQQDLFPQALQGTWLLQLPQLLVMGSMLFWVMRVALGRRWRADAQARGSMRARWRAAASQAPASPNTAPTASRLARSPSPGVSNRKVLP